MAKDEKRVRFGQRLRELREARGLSREQLHELAGLSERAIIQWELGEREPGWFNVLALAQALGVGVEAFTVEAAPAKPPARGRPRKAPTPEDKQGKEANKEKLTAQARERAAAKKKRASNG